jgi:hypothetical protein
MNITRKTMRSADRAEVVDAEGAVVTASVVSGGDPGSCIV